MPRIDAVNCDMDDRAGFPAVSPHRTDRVHHLRVADADGPPVDPGADSLPGHLGDILHRTAVILISEGIPERHRDRVRRIPLHVRREMEQLLLADLLRVQRRHLEHALRQRPRLIEYHSSGLRKAVHE